MLLISGVVIPLVLGGCGSDTDDSDIVTFDSADLRGNGTGDGGTGTGTGTGYVDPGEQDCLWVGNWQVTNAFCGEVQYNTWFTLYDATTLKVVHNENRGCDLVIKWVNAECTEEESWFAYPKQGDDQVVIESAGITTCQPDKCMFNPSDSPCQVGDRQTENTVLVKQNLGNDTLVFTHLVSFAAPSCNDALSLKFER